MGDNVSTSGGVTQVFRGLNSMSLFIESSQINEMTVTYQGFGELGYDSQTKEYLLEMFNNLGRGIQYTDGFSGDTLTLRTTTQTLRRPLDQKLNQYKSGENVRLEVPNDSGQSYVLTVDQMTTPVTARETIKKKKWPRTYDKAARTTRVLPDELRLSHQLVDWM